MNVSWTVTTDFPVTELVEDFEKFVKKEKIEPTKTTVEDFVWDNLDHYVPSSKLRCWTAEATNKVAEKVMKLWSGIQMRMEFP